MLPWIDHALPDEDGVGPVRPTQRWPPRRGVCGPYASNLDEFKLLEEVAHVVWAAHPADLDHADLIILPGSKHVGRDLAWLRASGLEDPVRRHVQAGRRLLGICGGLQMLGVRISDRSGRDTDSDGLGLLPLYTELAPTKRLAARTISRFMTLDGPWSELSGLAVAGYEIRHGRSAPADGAHAALPDGLGWVQGPVLGTYLHGLVESPGVVRAILGEAPARSRDQAIDQLTDEVMSGLDRGLLDRIVGIDPRDEVTRT